MPVARDQSLRQRGTRFKLFAQPRFLEPFREPETVWVSPPPGSIQPGPSDERMYVVDAIGKKPYDDESSPPYSGPSRPPAEPGADGHFDHLGPDDPAFEAAHIYGTVRRVLDIWEGYFGQPVEWHFQNDLARLELIPHVLWDNAHSGWGFLETGEGKAKSGRTHPYCLNFDVLAHEVGHSLIFSKLGIPNDDTLTAEYRGFHESSADIVALVSVLHFDRFVVQLLEGCHGNLAAKNELNSIAELSRNEEIRVAANGLKMPDVPDPRLPWHALTQKEIHRLGEPMTGALFDILVEVFQELLVDRGLISRELATLAFQTPDQPALAERVQRGFDAAYAANPEGFKQALVDARDYLGERLAQTWEQTSADDLHFADVAARFLAIDWALSGNRFRDIIVNCFLWREIGYGF